MSLIFPAGAEIGASLFWGPTAPLQALEATPLFSLDALSIVQDTFAAWQTTLQKTHGELATRFGELQEHIHSGGAGALKRAHQALTHIAEGWRGIPPEDHATLALGARGILRRHVLDLGNESTATQLLTYITTLSHSDPNQAIQLRHSFFVYLAILFRRGIDVDQLLEFASENAGGRMTLKTALAFREDLFGAEQRKRADALLVSRRGLFAEALADHRRTT